MFVRVASRAGVALAATCLPLARLVAAEGSGDVERLTARHAQAALRALVAARPGLIRATYTLLIIRPFRGKSSPAGRP